MVWALSNIAGDCAKFRDQLLENGVMERILRILDSPIDFELEKISYWLVSNLCRHKNPAPNFEIVTQCIPYLARCLRSEQTESISNACWALKYLADGPWYQINAIIEAGICKSLVRILNDDQSNTVGVLLVCINISSGSHDQTQELLSCGIVAVISKLLDSSRDQSVLKSIAFLVSNIAADEQQKIQELIDAEIFSKLAKTFEISNNETKIEILHAIENATLNGDNDQIIKIASGCTEILKAAIELNSEAKIIALQTLWNITLAQKETNQELTSLRNSKRHSNLIFFIRVT